MAKKERIRETVSGLPTLDHLMERTQAGWKLAAIEWERESKPRPNFKGIWITPESTRYFQDML